ncbi:hypothetical protein FIBSPDRAFT_930115 [Athelia psychrophila]|uniref:Uncharacterized protein n=1 Tax=Athelia psychrophila TaxID=1759441 RepID=A0A166MNR5_9AGAM|nr:hypothetical protein FIBSPDRAFT_930115 [Fibularhizoctonia sp. CBS 109695]
MDMSIRVMPGVNTARLAVLSDKLLDISSNRERLISQLEELEEQARAVKAEYNSILNHGAGIYTLPVEILMAIIQVGCIPFCAQDERFEVLVSHISSHWRQVALTTPSLWTTIRRVERCNRLDRIAAYLERSRSSLINLQVYIGSEDDEGDVSRFSELVEPHFNRVRRLFVGARSSAGLLKLFDCISSTTAPHLTAVNIDYRGDNKRIAPSSIFMGGAPSLSSLHIAGLRASSCLPPMQSITSLHLGRWHTPLSHNGFVELSDTLCGMQSLAHLQIAQTSSDHQWPAEVVVHLPKLKSLYIECAAFDAAVRISRLLVAFDAPALCTLVIAGRPYYEHRSTVHFDEADLLSTHSKFPVLRKLALHSTMTGMENLRRTALAFPSVEELLYGQPCGDLLTLLGDDQPAAVYWPNLTALALPLSDIPTPKLEDAVNARKRAGYPIRELFLRGHILAGLPSALLDGLKVTDCLDEKMQYISSWCY